jgi:radical SAM superfamily enzyme with C-terminal helix-hairpin-helix motif
VTSACDRTEHAAAIDRASRVAICVEVNTLYTHCAKAFRRGRVWDPASWEELNAPDTCESAIEDLSLNISVADARAGLEAAYARELADESVQPDR